MVFREDPEGRFTVLVPSLPGCVISKTLKEARQMATQAIALYFESIETQQSSQRPEQKKLRALCG